MRRSLKQGSGAQPPETLGCLLMNNLKMVIYSIIQEGQTYHSELLCTH